MPGDRAGLGGGEMIFGCKECRPEEIGANPFNPRHLEVSAEIRKLGALADSILRCGILEPPILSKVDGFDLLIPISGNRRIAALINVLKVDVVQYIPLEWRGYKEPITQEQCFPLTCEVHNVLVPHKAQVSAERAFEALQRGMNTEGLSDRVRRLLPVAEFLQDHPELRSLVFNFEGSSRKRPRTRVGHDIVRDALFRCGFNEDRTCHHLNKYISGVYKDQRELRAGIESENGDIALKEKKLLQQKMQRGELK